MQIKRLFSLFFLCFILFGCKLEHPQVKQSPQELVHKQKSLYKLNVDLPSSIPVEQPVTISIQILDKTTGKSVRDFKVDQGAYTHLTFVSKSLHRFQHFHPKFDNRGLLTAQVSFLKSGQNLMYVQFATKSQGEQILLYSFDVEGGQAFPPDFIPYDSPTNSTDGYKLMLIDRPHAIGVSDRFKIKIQRDNQDMTVESYLGFSCHAILINQDTLEMIPMIGVNNATNWQNGQTVYKSPLTLYTTLPKPGIYKLWLQFKKDKVLHTGHFTFLVCGQNCYD